MQKIILMQLTQFNAWSCAIWEIYAIKNSTLKSNCWCFCGFLLHSVASPVKPVHAWLRSTNPLPPENQLFLPYSLEIRVPPWMKRTTVSTPLQLVCSGRVQRTGPGLNSPLQNFSPAAPQRRLSPSTCAAPSVRKRGGKCARRSSMGK